MDITRLILAVSLALLLVGCTVHVQGDAGQISYAFDVTVDNIQIEIPPPMVPGKPYEYKVQRGPDPQPIFY